MGDLTKNFSRWEFGDPIEGTDYPDTYDVLAMARALEIVRWGLDTPLRVSSGWRSETYNRQLRRLYPVGHPQRPARRTQHQYGTAADIVPVRLEGVTLRERCTELGELILDGMRAGALPKGGVGIYVSWIHWDLRGRIVRWTK